MRRIAAGVAVRTCARVGLAGVCWLVLAACGGGGGGGGGGAPPPPAAYVDMGTLLLDGTTYVGSTGTTPHRYGFDCTGGTPCTLTIDSPGATSALLNLFQDAALTNLMAAAEYQVQPATLTFLAPGTGTYYAMALGDYALSATTGGSAVAGVATLTSLTLPGTLTDGQALTFSLLYTPSGLAPDVNIVLNPDLIVPGQVVQSGSGGSASISYLTWGDTRDGVTSYPITALGLQESGVFKYSSYAPAWNFSSFLTLTQYDATTNASYVADTTFARPSIAVSAASPVGTCTPPALTASPVPSTGQVPAAGQTFTVALAFSNGPADVTVTLHGTTFSGQGSGSATGLTTGNSVTVTTNNPLFWSPGDTFWLDVELRPNGSSTCLARYTRSDPHGMAGYGAAYYLRQLDTSAKRSYVAVSGTSVPTMLAPP